MSPVLSSSKPLARQDGVGSTVSLSKKYQISSIVRIFFARMFDIILSSLIPLVLDFTNRFWNLSLTITFVIMVLVTLSILIIYFILIPYFWQGQTCGKFLLRIKLVNSKNLWKFRYLITREVFIIFIPWIIQITCNLIIALVFKLNLSKVVADDNTHPAALIILRSSTAFYFFWFLGLTLAVAFDDKHQFFIDHKNNIFIVNTKQISPPRQPLSTTPPVSVVKNHIHLQEHQPGTISDDDLSF